MTHNSTECQQELIRLGYLAPKKADGSTSADGTFGTVSLEAFNHFLASKGKPPIGPKEWTLTQISAALFPEDAPPPAPSKPFTVPGISEIGNIISIFNQVKELQMNTANVDVISAWLSSKNWAAAIAILTNIAALFHIVIPPDLAPSVTAVVTSATALYILIKNTWFTTSVTAASAKKLG